MRCAKLQLKERTRVRPKSESRSNKPTRYCQKLMIDSDFKEDSKWTHALERFRCTDFDKEVSNEDKSESRIFSINNKLFLSVQNLQFKGELEHKQRPRTSFMYKTINGGKKHRMFVRQIIDENGCSEGDRASELTCYFLDDYAKYFNNDRSRPSSPKSSIFLHGPSNKQKENKAVQVDFKANLEKRKMTSKNDNKKNDRVKNDSILDVVNNYHDETLNKNINGAKVVLHKNSKRKSITISKLGSPETVHVIRVDVVYNHSYTSATTDCDDTKRQSTLNAESMSEQEETVRLKSHFTNKYRLTNTIKVVDENVSGAANVTLFCKTFRLTDRKNVQPNLKSYKPKINNSYNRRIKVKK